jgi:hypothetical protein
LFRTSRIPLLGVVALAGGTTLGKSHALIKGVLEVQNTTSQVAGLTSARRGLKDLA